MSWEKMIVKLIFCRKCHDVFKLSMEQRSCSCGLCTAFYHKDGLHAEYRGDTAVPIGFGNSTLTQAIKNQPVDGQGKEFTAFVIPQNCTTMVKTEPTFRSGDKVVCVSHNEICGLTIGREYKVIYGDSYIRLGSDSSINEWVIIMETDWEGRGEFPASNFEKV